MSLAPLVPLFAAGAFLLLVGATLLDAKPAVARNLYPEPGTTIGTPGQASAPGDPLFGPIPCEEGEAAGYSCENVDLLAHLPLSTFSASSASDVWGWQDPQTGKEYAVLGVSDGTVFVDLSETAQPVYLGRLPTASAPSLWHDVKVYDHYALAISEAAGHGLQIFDLRRLREVDSPPVTFAATAYYGGFGGAHNLAVNPESGFAYVVGAEQGQPCGGGLHMIDISTPASPSFAGCYSAEGMIHDTQCVNYQGPAEAYQGRELCFNSSVNAFTIVDVTDKEQPRQVASTGYRGLAYTHQGWATEDHYYFLLNDEFDVINYGLNTRIYIWNISDPEQPAMVGTYEGPNRATGHNIYLKDGYVYAANYAEGLRILHPVLLADGSLESVAHFDTYPPHDAGGYYYGAWTAYPYFEDKVVVSTIGEGLFILRPRLPGD